MRKSSLFILVVFAVIGFLAFAGCKKSKGPAKGEITVLDATGTPYAGVSVTLYSKGNAGPLASYLPDKKTTDGSGKTFHSFPYAALLYIDVTDGTKLVTDYIRLEEGKTVTKTIKL